MGLLNDEIKNLFVLIASTSMNKKNDEVLSLIDVLEKLIMLDNPEGEHNDLSFDADYIYLLNGFPQKVSQMDSDEYINYIEPMLKKIVRTVYPIVWEEIWSEYNKKIEDGERAKYAWTLAALYKKVGVRNKNWTLNPENYKFDENYLEHYVRVFQGRNKGAHGNNTKVFNSLVIVYMDLCEKYEDAIIDSYTKQELLRAIDVKEYCNKIIDEYKREKLDKSYEMVNWGSEEIRDVTTENLEEKLHNKKAKLIGGPGVGKSAALMHCRYCACKRIIEKNEIKIPVLIELWKTKDNTLDTLIANELGIAEDILNSVYEKNMISLYLDGYNEVIEDEDKQRIATRIDDMIRLYPDMQILITDRQEFSVPIVAEKAIPFRIKKLSDAQTAGLLGKTVYAMCNDDDEAAELTKLLVDETNPEKLSESVSELKKQIKQWTPYLVTVIAKYACYRKVVLTKDKFWKKYLDELFTRECTDKKEYRINTLADMLTYIAKNDNGKTITRSRLMELLSDFDANMSKETMDSYLELSKEMRLYLPESTKCEFFEPGIRDYFYNEMFPYGAIGGESEADSEYLF